MAERIIEMPDGHGMGTTHIRERIVRCRDCERATKNGTRCYHFMTLDCWENPVPSEVEPDGYCKWGVRRTDG